MLPEDTRLYKMYFERIILVVYKVHNSYPWREDDEGGGHQREFQIRRSTRTRTLILSSSDSGADDS